MRFVAVAAVALCCASGSAAAADILSLDVSHDANRYRLALSARLDSSLPDSYAAFSDFDNLPAINDAVERVRWLDGAPDDARRLYSRVRVCVWFFCKHLTQVQDIRQSGTRDAPEITAEVLPALSNLRYGRARWRMASCDKQTCLDFEAELEPDFWVPPLIGPMLIERTMRREALTTARGIERLANQRQ